MEAAIRCCDNFQVKQEDVFKILNWKKTQFDNIEIPFKASRVILQDLTGVPALVDFAAMRDAISKFGGSPEKINPLCPTDLIIDHSVQVDYTRAYVTILFYHFSFFTFYSVYLIIFDCNNFTWKLSCRHKIIFWRLVSNHSFLLPLLSRF